MCICKLDKFIAISLYSSLVNKNLSVMHTFCCWDVRYGITCKWPENKLSGIGRPCSKQSRLTWAEVIIYVLMILDNLRAVEYVWLCVLGWRGERNFMDERQGGSVIFFFPTTVILNDPSHTPFTQPLLLTQDCVWFIGHRILALFTLQIPLIWENHAGCGKLSDRCLLWAWHAFSCLRMHWFYQTSHAHTHRSIWKYFPLFVYVLVCVVLGFGHKSQEATLDVLSTHEAERIIECTGQNEEMNWTGETYALKMYNKLNDKWMKMVDHKLIQCSQPTNNNAA